MLTRTRTCTKLSVSLSGKPWAACGRRHSPGIFRMNRHDYVRYRFRQALVESEGFDLIAMGRPEGSGCYCFANDLLSECMGELERDYHFIVIDSEAGMEHMSFMAIRVVNISVN